VNGVCLWIRPDLYVTLFYESKGRGLFLGCASAIRLHISLGHSGYIAV
jgi:hypothetical protein